MLWASEDVRTRYLTAPRPVESQLTRPESRQPSFTVSRDYKERPETGTTTRQDTLGRVPMAASNGSWLSSYPGRISASHVAYGIGAE